MKDLPFFIRHSRFGLADRYAACRCSFTPIVLLCATSVQ